jgi:hypothetical protein
VRGAVPSAGWLLVGCGCGAATRRAGARTDAWDAEAHGSLPGDDLIPHPRVEWTRGLTVHADPEQIWPWRVQTGYGRAGWDTPEWVDLFANLWVFGVRSRFPRVLIGCCAGTSSSAWPSKLSNRRRLPDTLPTTVVLPEWAGRT